MGSEELVGTWQLISAAALRAAAEVTHPYGEGPVGYLTYSAQGYVTVVVMGRGRPAFAAGDLAAGTPEEIKAAFEGFEAYAVTHHVLAARFPNWIGSDQVRYVSLTGDELQLSTPLIFYRGEEWTFALGYGAYLPTGIAWDDSSGDYLSTKELGEALLWATDEHADPLEVLYLEASMMATIEVAYELRDAAAYLVASEGAVWARFAYDQYFAGVDGNTTAQELAEGIVESYANSLPGYPLTMGAIAIQSSALAPLVSATNDLAAALTASLATTRPYVSQAYAASQKFDSNWDLTLAAPDAHVDLYDFASKLLGVVPAGETAVRSAAQAVINAWG